MDHQPNTPVETREQEMQRIDQFKQAACAGAEELTGLTFDWKTGMCTTPGEVKMQGELKERWESLCNQMGEASAARDAQKVQELWGEMGKFLREAAQQGETGTTDACAKPDA